MKRFPLEGLARDREDDEAEAQVEAGQPAGQEVQFVEQPELENRDDPLLEDLPVEPPARDGDGIEELEDLDLEAGLGELFVSQYSSAR